VQLSHARAFIIAVALALAATSGAAQVDSRVHQSAARLQPFTIRDTVYRRERSLWVYLPANYDAKRATPYPLIVAFDGAEYQDTLPLPFILDTLLAASRAPAFIAVLIDNGERAERIADLGNAPRMVRFLGDQLIPWTRARWHVSTDPHQVIITGSSAGGLASAYAALMRPDLFGNVVSQSGAFWRGADASNDAPYEWLTAEVRRLPKRDVRFVLDVGELEDHATLGGAGPNFRDANRRFRDALQAKGYDVVYTEVPGGQHAPIYWTPRLPVDLLTVTAAWHNGPH
jgi:enterochelin esterase family protein